MTIHKGMTGREPSHQAPRIYLAGPDVFLPDAIEAGKRKKVLCQKYGFEGVYPLLISA
jgi:nucleoside 2-deoxyribosyltransferase